jgi:hypothetical protein
MHAALQQLPGTMPVAGTVLAWVRPLVPETIAPARPMPAEKPRKFHIQGVTLDGKTFRPSDWAERLAGAMSSFRPGGGQGGISAYIGYSPFCVPQTDGSIKCVLISEELRDIEPMAWDFVMSFARDNNLKLVELANAAEMQPPAAPQ